MRSLVRLIAAILVAAIGTAAIAVAATPELARLATSFKIEAGPLPALAELTQQSVVYDAFGNQIDELRIENREAFTLGEVPQHLIDAVVATEDEGFFSHKGVSAKGVARAAIANANSTAVQGGSTITQQLIKNALVGSERSTRRKVLEAAYAVRLEREWTKEEILERYLNTVYLGNNAYGFKAAAFTYFGKPLGEIDLNEAAFLAGLIRNPVGYDPIQRSEQARSRFRVVIGRLVEVGRITPEDGEARTATWALPDRLQRSATPPKANSYFTAEVRNQLLVRSNYIGADYQERYQRLFRGGLKVYTTFEPNIQASAEAARDAVLPDTGGRFDAAMVTLDTKTAAVRALVGGRDFKTSEVNLALTGRQTGSAGKGFILAAAMNSGIQNNDVVDGTLPCTWVFPDKSQPDYEVDDGVSKPSGTVEQHTWDSINCAYIRLYLAAGGPRVIETMTQIGVKTDPPLLDIFSFAVGGNEVSPLRMATGYATIANQGLKHEPYYIERIEDRTGHVIYQHENDAVQVLAPAVAHRTVDILKGTIRQGTATRARLDGNRPAAGKTGTYTANKHAWFIGFTPQYTTAVYMGNPRDPNDSMTGVPQFKQFYSVQGGTYPALMWKAHMDLIHTNFEIEDWPKPGANPRPPARVYAPGQDCFAAFVQPKPAGGEATDDEDPAPAVLQRTSLRTTPFATEPTDLMGPSPTAPNWVTTYSCAKGLPYVTQAAATTTTAKPKPSASSTPPSSGASTTKAPATTKKP